MESLQAGSLANERSQKRRKKLYIFLFCFIVSAFFWLLIQLAEEYSEVNTFPIAFSNIPPGKVITGIDDTLLTLNMKVRGFNLLANLVFFDPEIISVDVSLAMHKKRGSSQDYYIVTSEIMNSVSKQIHQKNNILSISPDTLNFSLPEKISKKVPVKNKVLVSCTQQYSLTDSMIIFPESVMVSGAKWIIDSINFLETEKRRLTGISSSQALKLGFSGSHSERVLIEPANVSVYIPVEKYTEATIDVPVEIYNGSQKIRSKTFPEKITITYLVPLSKFKKTSSGSFFVKADIATKGSSEKKLKVEIEKMPSYVKILKTEPEKVEYIILK